MTGAQQAPKLPLHRLEQFGVLSESDRCYLEGHAGLPVFVQKADIIQAQGVAQEFVFLLISGWVSSSVLLPDGCQQMVSIHLPGDMLGFASLALRRTAECLKALTSVTLVRLPLRAIGATFEMAPSLAAMFFLMAQRERVALMDAMTSMGQTPATSRLAAILIDISDRLAAADMSNRDSFECPLRQEQVAELAGLSTVHVNRIIHALQVGKLVRWHRRRVAILDRIGLERLAQRHLRVPHDSPDWLHRHLVPSAS